MSCKRNTTVSSVSGARTPKSNTVHSRRVPRGSAGRESSLSLPVVKSKARISAEVEINEIPSFREFDHLPGSKRSNTKSEPVRSAHMVNFRLGGQEPTTDSRQSSSRARSLKSAPGRISRGPLVDITPATNKSDGSSFSSKGTTSLSVASVAESRRASSRTALSKIAASRCSNVSIFDVDSNPLLPAAPPNSPSTTHAGSHSASASAAPRGDSTENMFVPADMTPTEVHVKSSSARPISVLSVDSSDNSFSKLCDNVISLGLYRPGNAGACTSDAVLRESDVAASNLIESTTHGTVERDTIIEAMSSLALLNKHRLDGDLCAREGDHGASSTPCSRQSRKSWKSTHSKKSTLTQSRLSVAMNRLDGARGSCAGSSSGYHLTEPNSESRILSTRSHHLGGHSIDVGSHCEDLTAPNTWRSPGLELHNLQSPVSRNTTGRCASDCLPESRGHAMERMAQATRTSTQMERPEMVNLRQKRSILKRIGMAESHPTGLCARSTSTVNFALNDDGQEPRLDAADDEAVHGPADMMVDGDVGMLTAASMDNISRSTGHTSLMTAIDELCSSASSRTAFSKRLASLKSDTSLGSHNPPAKPTNSLYKSHMSPLPHRCNCTNDSLPIRAQQTDAERLPETFAHSRFLRKASSSTLEQQISPSVTDETLSTLRNQEEVTDTPIPDPTAHSRPVSQLDLDNIIDTILIESEISALDPGDVDSTFSSRITYDIPMKLLSGLKLTDNGVCLHNYLTVADHQEDNNVSLTPRSKISVKSGKSGRSRKSSHYVHMAMNKLDGARSVAMDNSEMMSPRSCALESPKATNRWPSEDTSMSKTMQHSHPPQQLGCPSVFANLQNLRSPVANPNSDVWSPEPAAGGNMEKNGILVDSTRVVTPTDGTCGSSIVKRTPHEGRSCKIDIERQKSLPSMNTATSGKGGGCERSNHLRLPSRIESRKKGSILKMLDTISTSTSGSQAHVVFSKACSCAADAKLSSQTLPLAQPKPDGDASFVSTMPLAAIPDVLAIDNKTTYAPPSRALSVPLHHVRTTEPLVAGTTSPHGPGALRTAMSSMSSETYCKTRRAITIIEENEVSDTNK
eukprot:GEMP01005964.1.p1 GENE.GEMP01005964.1~~GEMP01005964.1.p1  ORF type:complete len:1084 (+),score=205.18 GEMP01005964.1:204-3455(+)